MKKIAILVCCCISQLVLGQTLSDEERDFAVGILEANTKNFLTAIENISDTQWRFKVADDKWSIADVSEHIALADGFLLAVVQKTLQSPADSEKAKMLEGTNYFTKSSRSR
jgi:uncharacterized damage-inducible protein DinB